MFSTLKVRSPNIRYTPGFIESQFLYEHVNCSVEDGDLVATPVQTQITFRTSTKLPKLGVMLIGKIYLSISLSTLISISRLSPMRSSGWAGNNGTTLTAAILANQKKLSWKTKNGEHRANYFGSITQSSTVYIGNLNNETKQQDAYVRMADLVPMVEANSLVLDGWDIVPDDLGESMRKARVLDINLQDQLYDDLKVMRPRKAIFDPDFIASNQRTKATNIIADKSKWNQVQAIREDIRDFKTKNDLDKVILVWTANTERLVKVTDGVHDTAENLLAAIKSDKAELSPSILYGVASILEGCTYINGSPQNTFVSGLVELAEGEGVFIAGEDFKTGQTKWKSIIVDFLTSAGIKPRAIVSYNHLGNNDGLNLSESKQFRSKEISKLSVIEDAVRSNPILFEDGKQPDHVVVIKYVPFVGDSKRAIDEYSSELMLGGNSQVIIHNTCEDSLLAAPIIIDLVLLAELCERVRFRIRGGSNKGDDFQQFNSALSLLSYLLKSPLAERNATAVNSLFKQRYLIENLLRALVALPPINFLDFRFKLSDQSKWFEQQASLVQNS